MSDQITDYAKAINSPAHLDAFLGKTMCEYFSNHQGISREILIHDFRNQLDYLDPEDKRNEYRISVLKAALSRLTTMEERKP